MFRIDVPSEQCSCPVFVDGAVVVVAPSGEIDIASAPVLDEAFRVALLTADLIVVDLREVSFIDSTGVRLLTAAARRVRRAGSQMTLEAPPPHVVRVLELLGADAATAPDPHPSAAPFPQ